MSEEDDGAERSHEPSQKRLEDARKRGEMPMSADLITAAGYGGFLIAASTLGGTAILTLASQLQGILAHAAGLADDLFAGSGAPLSAGLLQAAGSALLPWFGLPAALALAALIAQRGPVLAPVKLEPKLSRLSPLASLGNKFGLSGLFEFGKSLVKLATYSLVLGVYLVLELPGLIASARLDPAQATLAMLQMTLGFLWMVLGIALTLGVLDLLFQHVDFRRRNMMTRQELIEEMKESEGDPQLKAQRRQKAVSLAMNPMLAEVPRADVVIVNPTHYAVALAWDPDRDGAPRCVAKGTDEIALRIRAIAVEHGVPIQSDPQTARALFAETDIGVEIGRKHYRAVAAAIRFAERIRKKARPV